MAVAVLQQTAFGSCRTDAWLILLLKGLRGANSCQLEAVLGFISKPPH